MLYINSINNDYKQKYEPRNSAIKASGMLLAWAGEPYIGKILSYPRDKFVLSSLKKNQIGQVLPYVEKAVKVSGIEDGFRIINLNEETAEKVAKELGIRGRMPQISKMKTFLRRFFRNPVDKRENIFKRTLEGTNAFFVPAKNAIVCNFDKFGASAFHEIGHKLNTKSSNLLMKTLTKLKGPCAKDIPILISMIAITTDPKDKNDPNRNFLDGIKSNCGVIAALGLLPITLEECAANIKGSRLAKKVGLPNEMLEKVKKSNRTSAVSYILNMVIVGFAIQISSKLRDLICVKKVKADLN